MRKRILVLTIVTLTVLAPSALVAQGRGMGQPQGRGQRPPRDVAVPAERTGTGVISGRVIAADTSRPLKRARVVIAGVGRPRTVTTDEAGRYQIAALPPGTFTIRANKTGFVDAAFGQRRAAREGTPIQLTDGQRVTNVDFALARGAVLAGRVLDEDGEPLARIVVQALRHQYQRGERRLVIVGGDQTDDRGQYRIFGLTPGEYVVSATVPAMDGFLRRVIMSAPAPEAGIDYAGEGTGYAPTYYPGVTMSADASRLKVAAAQELNGVDFQLQVVPLATVRGTALTGTGTVILVADDGGRVPGLRGRVEENGTFSIPNVPPGKYLAMARSEGAAGAGPSTAILPFAVAGEDVTLTLAPVPLARLGGTVTFESSGTPPPKAFTGFRVTAQPLAALLSLPRMNRAFEMSPAGQFELPELLPGQYVIQGSAPRGWTMKSVYLDGRDVTDHAIELKPGERANGLNVIFSDRISGVAGTVRAAGDAPAAGISVIAFPSDEKSWRPQSRRIQTARAAQNGAYRIPDLPAGDYLIVATDDVEQGEWFDPAFLESVRDKAVRVTIAEGEQRIQDLKSS